MIVERFLRFELNAPTPIQYDFNFEHAIALYFVFLAFVILLQVRRWMIAHQHLSRFDSGLGYVLLFLPFIYTWSVASIGQADWQTDLPFHLPYILSFVLGLALLKGYKAPLRRLYLLTIVTISFQVLFPLNPSYSNSPLLFIIQYAHIMILLLTVAHLTLSKKITLNWYLLVSNIKWTTFILLFFFAANLIMESNYVYINHAPYEGWTPLLWLPSLPGTYLVSALALTLAMESVVFTLVAFPLVRSTVKALVTSHD